MISVIIATYNRSEDLKGVLACLLTQEISTGYEVLIIDNNSNDDTKSVVESFIPSFQGRLKYLFEPRQGKPYAINRGLKEAIGEIIVLTDDDCTFENDYLMTIYKTFEENGPSIGFIGGRIIPRWVNCTKPKWFNLLEPEWFKEHFWGPLAILDYGEEPFIIDHHQINHNTKKLFYGANISVRKEIFLKYGDFNLEKIVAEDTEFQLRFLKEGVLGLYAPKVQVYHKVTPQRLDPEYYYRWYYSRGIYREILENYPPKFYHPLGIRYAFIIKTIKMWLGSLGPRSSIKKMHMRCVALFNLGQMRQIARKNIF